MNKFQWLIIFLLFFGNGLHGQSKKIKGNVKANGQGLENASVTIIKVIEADSIILAYQFTDSKGEFEIEYDIDNSHSTYLITANLLGYKKFILPFTKIDSISIELFTNETLLESFEVKSQKWPIVQKNDTTIYNASSFRKGNERNLEDLLKKLPGIKVQDNGEITFKGKKIEKVLVEGEDIFSNNYTVLTKNINANYIETVEAIDNFSDDPILKEFEKSNDVVLNLTVYKKYKIRIFGDLNLIAGLPKNGEISTNCFLLGKKLKLGLIGNFNNLGTTPYGDAQFYLNDKKSFQSSFINISQIQPFINTEIKTLSSIFSERYVYNNAKLGGISISSSVFKNLKTSASLIIYEDKNEVISSNNFSYKNIESSFFTSDSTISSSSPQQIQANWKAESKVNANNYLTFSYLFEGQNSKFNRKINSVNSFFPDLIFSNLETISSKHVLNSSLTNKIDSSKIIVFKINGVLNAINQNLSSESKRYGLNQNLIDKNLLQNIFQTQNSLKIFTILKNKLGKKSFSSRLSFDFLEESIIQIENNFQDKLKLSKSIFTFGNELLIEKNGYKTAIGVDFFVPSIASNSIKIKNLIRVSPVVVLSKTFDNDKKLFFLIAQSLSLPSITEVFGKSIFTDYKSILDMPNELKTQPMQIFKLIYKISNMERLFFSELDITAGRSSNMLIDSLVIDNIFVKNKKIYYQNLLNFASATLDLDKKLGSNSSFIRTSFSFNHNENVKYLNSSNLTKFNRENISAKIGYAGMIGKEVHFELSYAVNYLLINIPNNASIKIIQANPFSVIRYLPTLSTSFKLIGEYNIWKQNGSKTSTPFIDFVFNHSPSNSKISFGLQINNVLNQNLFSLKTSDVFWLSNDSWRLQPRMILFNTSIKLN